MNSIRELSYRTKTSAVLACLVTFVGLGIQSVAYAQSGYSAWLSPVEFFEVEMGGNVQSPRLLVDGGGNLHAFWGVALAEGQSSDLYYSRWNGVEWSSPVNVLTSPDGRSAWPMYMWIDDESNVHVFWGAGDRGLWHSEAHASQLGDVHAWAPAQLIPTEDVPFTGVGIAQDEQGVWYLAYTNRQLNAVRLLRSVDDMVSWLPETLVYGGVASDTWIGYPGVVVAPNGDLWLWWHELTAGPGVKKGVLYARSTDRGQSWASPERMIKGYYSGGFQVIDDTIVQLVSGGIGTGGRYVSFSWDSGATWTPPRDIGLGFGEGMQSIGLAVDSAGIWHFVVESGGTFATVVWDQGTWLPPEFIVSREEIKTCCTTPGKTTENAVVAIAAGNQMHVIFEQDDRVLWHTSKQLDAPYAPIVPLPVPTESTGQQEDVQPTETSVPTLTPESLSLPGVGNVPGSSLGQSRWMPVLAGAIPATLLVGLVLVLGVSRRKRD